MKIRIGKMLFAALLIASLSGCAITINRPGRQCPPPAPAQRPPLRDSRSNPERPTGPIYDMPRRVDADPHWREFPRPVYFFEFRW